LCTAAAGFLVSEKLLTKHFHPIRVRTREREKEGGERKRAIMGEGINFHSTSSMALAMTFANEIDVAAAFHLAGKTPLLFIA